MEHNWKLAQVSGQLSPSVRPHNPATGFRPPSATVVSAEPFFAQNRDTVVPAEGNGDFQTLICPCDEAQTMLHIVESCPLTKLNGGLSRLHSVDEDGVLWTQCTCNSYRQLNINFYTSYLGPLALAKMSSIS